MDILELMKKRRSIRKYQDKQIDREDLEKIIEAGLYAPNAGGYVSSEQPSNIDDPTIKNGFYEAPTVCVIFGAKNFLYSVPDAFCCAENMVLEAANLGIASCIIARGEETFDNEVGMGLLNKWGITDTDIARCFVILGYCDGEYPQIKPRKENRFLVID